MTLTKLLARLEGEQLRRYWFARPILTAMIPHLSEDGIKSIIRGVGKGSGKPSSAGRALEILLKDYLPPSLRERESKVRKPIVIDGLPVAAARGIMIGYDRGDFHDNVVWVSVNPYFAGISATAKRGG